MHKPIKSGLEQLSQVGSQATDETLHGFDLHPMLVGVGDVVARSDVADDAFGQVVHERDHHRRVGHVVEKVLVQLEQKFRSFGNQKRQGKCN